MSYASSYPRQRQPHLYSSSTSSFRSSSESDSPLNSHSLSQPTYVQYSHHKSHQSALSKRIRTIIVLLFLIALIIGVSYLVYKYGGPTAVYERADEFVHFPEVTTPVDPIEKLTEGVVSVATQIAGAVTQAAGQVADGAKDAADKVGDGAKDAADKIKGVFGGIGRERY